MNRVLQSLLFFVFALFVGVSFLRAEDPPKKTQYDKFGKPIRETIHTTTINPPLKATGVTPTAEGDSPFQREVTPEVPRTLCRDFNYDGDAIAPVRRPAGYSCPPGYACRIVDDRLGTFNCQYLFGSARELYADDPHCAWAFCTSY